ncbi:MAG: DUF6391 domain-containing protein [Ardenticatenia bacterium]|nr:DUF6391 domain-containing protein [Ardenticatenia bacterium]
MIRQLLKWMLELPGVGKVRRVHALEHATITLLSQRVADLHIAGRSTPRGFWLYGDVDTDEVRRAVADALDLLRRGVSSLAIHPNCGTNIAVAGVIAGVMSFLASASWGRREHPINRVPRAVLAATASVILARPLGFWVQAHVTTSPDVHNLHVGEIRRFKRGRLTVHFVEVR